MPRDVLHRALSDDLKTELPPGLSRAVQHHPSLYALGAILPDFFYFDALPRVRHIDGARTHYSERLHRNSEHAYNFPFRLLRRASDNRQEMLRALGAGIITHNAIDATFHPYIHAHSGVETTEASIRHQLLETVISQSLLNHRDESYSDWGISGLPTPHSLQETGLPRIITNELYDQPSSATQQDFIALYRTTQRIQSLYRVVPAGAVLQLADPALPGAFRRMTSLFYPPQSMDLIEATTPLRLLNAVTGDITEASLVDLSGRARERARASLQHFAQAVRDPVSPAHFRAHAPCRSPETGQPLGQDQELRYTQPLDIRHWWDVPRALNSLVA